MTARTPADGNGLERFTSGPWIWHVLTPSIHIEMCSMLHWRTDYFMKRIVYPVTIFYSPSFCSKPVLYLNFIYVQASKWIHSFGIFSIYICSYLFYIQIRFTDKLDSNWSYQVQFTGGKYFLNNETVHCKKKYFYRKILYKCYQ